MLYQQKNSVGSFFFEMIEYRDFSFRPHMHRHYELVYVREGALITEIFNKKELVCTGQLAFIPSNCLHAYFTPEHSVVDVCIFSSDYVPMFTQSIRKKQAMSCVFFCRSSVLQFAEQELFAAGHVPDLFTAKAVLYAIAGEICNSIPFQDSSEKHEILLDSAVQYIAAHFREDITLNSLAMALGYEPHYLSRCFHRAIPMHFSNYVNLFRVDAAAELLRNSELTVADVAFESGFKSVRTFNRSFIQITGQSPHVYRQAIMQDVHTQKSSLQAGDV